MVTDNGKCVCAVMMKSFETSEQERKQTTAEQQHRIIPCSLCVVYIYLNTLNNCINETCDICQFQMDKKQQNQMNRSKNEKKKKINNYNG